MRRQSQFETIRSEGALLPTELLQRVSERDRDLGGLRGEDYGLPPNEPLNEAIVRSYNRLIGAWASFQDAKTRLPEGDPGTTITRDRWLLVLLHELGYGRVPKVDKVELDGKSYPVSHAWGNSPIHLVGCNVKLGTRTPGVAGAATQSPHGTLQELLNRSDDRLWGIVSNGLQLRLLRDNSSLTRQAYVEFDLEQMMDGEVYADFVLLWMVCHASRVEGGKPYECWLERWSQEAAEQGTRALDGLRNGVEAAISVVGSGFLAPGTNGGLKAALRTGELSTQEYYREILRLVYRMLFLFVAEDRGLLHLPRAPDEARARYVRWYSTRRLRALAEKRRGTKHSDLWEGLTFVMRSLSSDDGCEPLGLPALGSFLWSDRALPHLEQSRLPNRSLLEAVRSLATVQEGRVLRAVDYKNLGAEELGSVYESLLELHPRLDLDSGTFSLDTAVGNERKTTGAYYTPTSLIKVLLDSALDPVLDEAAAKGADAILELKVVDPACGSGHFLVAAAHRIAKRLASARTGDEEPSPEATRHALRDVVSRCIYGVDLNPMAVELCKVSLWMEALDPGRPLSFLDAHIKSGNSLLGATSLLLGRGVPDEAFKALEGDHKESVKALRHQNAQERDGQLTLDDGALDLVGALEAEVVTAEGIADESVRSLHEKERRFRELRGSESYERARDAADSWFSAFTQHKEVGAPRITSGVVRRFSSGGSGVSEEVRAEVDRLTQEYAPFHWEIEFPQVFGRSSRGFDVVLANPPWETLQMTEKEFFAGQPEIAGAKNAAARKRLIAALAVEDPPLFQAYRVALRRVEAVNHFVRASGRYPLTARGKINTYAVFAELMRSLVGPQGRLACIVPTGIATDATTQFFFRELVESSVLQSLYSFENEAKIFSSNHNELKFCLMTLRGVGGGSAADLAFFLRHVTDLADSDRHFSLTSDDFALFNPNTRTCPTFRSQRDADLTRAIYLRVPVLVQDPSHNPWGVSFRQGLFNIASDSAMFHGAPAPGRVPLYEGKMIHLYDHRFGTYEGQTQPQANKGVLPPVTDEQHADPDYSPRPRYWIDASQVSARLTEWNRNWLIGWRDITNAVTFRTMIAAAMPATAVVGEIILINPTIGEPVCLLAVLNSFALDYVARQKLGGTHVKSYIAAQFPVIPPSVLEDDAEWDVTQSRANWIRQRALELSFTSNDLQALARDSGYDGRPFCWDPERRAVIRAELDAAIFHLYGVAHEDVEYIMDTFWVVRDRDIRAFGEYRTKRLILDIYDQLARAVETGDPYESRLDPPPADPRVAHSPSPSRVATSL